MQRLVSVFFLLAFHLSLLFAQENADTHVGKHFFLQFTDVLGGELISTGQAEGEYTLIHFWYSACDPCRAVFPRVKALYEEYARHGVRFIGVSMDKSTSTVRDYCLRNTIEWPQFVAGWESPLAHEWGVDSVPRVFLLDGEGIILSDRRLHDAEALLEDLYREGAGE